MREKKTINANMLIICPGADEKVRFPNDKRTASWRNRTDTAPKMHSFMTELYDCVAFGEDGNTYCGKWMCSSFDLSFQKRWFSYFGVKPK